MVLGVNEEKIPKGKYGAVLFDECHDFKPTWFNLLVQMVDPATMKGEYGVNLVLPVWE